MTGINVAELEPVGEFGSKAWCEACARYGVQLLEDGDLPADIEWGFSEIYTHPPARLLEGGREMSAYYIMVKDGGITGGDGAPAGIRREALASGSSAAPGTAPRLAAVQGEPRGPIAADDAPVLVETKDLTVEFPLRAWPQKKVLVAVDGVSLRVRQGHSLGVVGESGSGKTTLAMAMVRLIRSRGEIVFDGEPIQVLGFKQLKPLRRSMQIVFQDPYGSLSPRLTVEEIVGEGLGIHEPGLTATERRERVAEVLGEVGLDAGIQSRYPHEFSGGQRQRIAVARAMILRPRFVVLDEPTSSLDMTVQAQIVELLLDLQQRHGLTYLFISHDLKVVRALCDDIVVMKDGRIVEQGPADQLYDAPREPYTQALMNAALGGPASAPASGPSR